MDTPENNADKSNSKVIKQDSPACQGISSWSFPHQSIDLYVTFRTLVHILYQCRTITKEKQQEIILEKFE